MQSSRRIQNHGSRYHLRWQRRNLRRFSWDEALEIHRANIHTVMKHESWKSLSGSTSIPAMSMVSYTAGAHFMQLMRRFLSFYDWYCDLPPNSPEV
ncbi:MAG: molybdopterin-dependent oxidoreductase [bacterium]|nr:molybdopterin-dependent oxidoreductase [bacterium]